MEDEHDSISEALLRKEKELQHIAKMRIAQLQEQLTLKDQYVNELQQRLKRICEDFNYNFQLIEERDRELHSFEQQVSALTSACKAKDADLSDLRRALQTKEDDYRADVDYLKQQLDDAQQGIEVMKSREAQLMQQEAEAALRVETIEKTLREKERDLAKANAMVESRTATLENERNELSERLAVEAEKFDRLMEIERGKLRDVLEEHTQCGAILKECERRLKDETNTLQMLNASKDGQLEESEKRIKQLESERAELMKDQQKIRKDRDSELSELRSHILDDAEVNRQKEQIRALQEANHAAKNQKSTLEEVIANLERELDLERKERAKDRRSIRDAQARMESETHFAIEKNTQWQTIAESRAEEVATTRVSSIQRNLVQAEEQARHFEREFMRMKKAIELESAKAAEEARKNTNLLTQVTMLERDKARLMAELRMAKVTGGGEGEGMAGGGTRREKISVDMQMREHDSRRDEFAYIPPSTDLIYRDRPAATAPRALESDLLSPSFHTKKQLMERFTTRKESALDTIPSRDSRLMVGLKQRIALVKDQLENEFQSPKATI